MTKDFVKILIIQNTFNNIYIYIKDLIYELLLVIDNTINYLYKTKKLETLKELAPRYIKNGRNMNKTKKIQNKKKDYFI